MGTSASAAAPSARQPLPHLGITLLLVIGLLGHVLAAWLMGGHRIAYIHHVGGFFLLLAVTGPVIAALGYRLWRTHTAALLLGIAAVQMLLGLWIAYAQY